jgi:hypothetical protein
MALPANDKLIGDLGHTEDHNAIVNEITFIQQNYISASSTLLTDNYLRKDTASATYATKSSPTFTGMPAAPTASSGTNTTQIATTQFVRTEINNLVASAPGALDTLNELAAALGNDSNFATTITNSLASKLDSGTASSLYLTRSNASATYFPISASGALLTESEASAIYFPLSSSGLLLTEQEAADTYLPISASSSLAPIGYLTEASASAIYLSKTDAESTYFPISASGGLLTETEASALYLPISASSTLAPIGYLSSSAAAEIYLRQDTASSVYATLISPVFSGTPSAPTVSAGDISSRIATTEFVANAVLAVQTGSATIDLSVYLRQDTASATYLDKNDIIDGGEP